MEQKVSSWARPNVTVLASPAAPARCGNDFRRFAASKPNAMAVLGYVQDSYASMGLANSEDIESKREILEQVSRGNLNKALHLAAQHFEDAQMRYVRVASA